MALKIRNIAIIAHVDHGKTTLVDQMLKQTGVFRDNEQVGEQILDSNPLERERGITILSKNISVRWHDVKINLIDTPGHADFGGEVERVLRMADGVLLLVDAFEGPMPQTRFVLRKALDLGHRVLVVLNKIDRPDCRPIEVLDEVFELFLELEANDTQLDFPVVYASARDGYARREPDDSNDDITPLLDLILESIHPPESDPDAPFRMQVTTLEDNDYIGRIAIGRILQGTAKLNQSIAVIRPDGQSTSRKVQELFTFEALGRQPAETAIAGDLCAIAGIGEVEIGDTLTHPEHREAMPAIAIEEPTIRMLFTVNDGPFAGQDGIYVTSRQIRDRLHREEKRNVALRVEESEERDGLVVSGRGILHLGILVENMRREGYEFCVGKPRVIRKVIDGKTCEPIETVMVEVPSDYAGKVIEQLGTRRGEMVSMEQRGNTAHLVFRVPSRGLIGVRTRLLTQTAGEAIFHHSFDAYEPDRGTIARRQGGTLVSSEAGSTTTYALHGLQDRGFLFVGPGAPVYEGMIVGEFNKDGDPVVNVCRGRKLTNVRAASSDRTLRIAPARAMSLEEALEYIEDDEYLEVTPKNLRLRKKILTEAERKKARRRAAQAM